MTKTPAEPTNLVLEQLRVMRAETNARFDHVEARFNAVDAKIAGIEKELRGLKLNTIAEIYKANLTVASFADQERRIRSWSASPHNRGIPGRPITSAATPYPAPAHNPTRSCPARTSISQV